MPYWRISGFYFFYFASLGALVPYWGLYLQDLEFSPAEIGELIASLQATKIVAPNLWGWIVDRTGKRMRIVRLAGLISPLAFVGVFFGSGYWWMMMVMIAFSFFWNASLPQFEATTLNHLGRDTHRYSQVRVWGSIGFVLVVAALGPLLDRFGTVLVPPVVLGLFAGIWLMSLTVPEKGHPHSHLASGSIMAIIKKPEVIAFLVVCFLMQAGHAPYYAFFSIYLEAHDYSRTAIGVLWALGVGAEVLLFVFMHRILQRVNVRRVLIISLALASVRWLLVAKFVDTAWVMVFAQLLHAATFGSFHAAAIHLVHTYFVGQHQGRGQAFYSSISFGLGGMLGSLYSGYLWSGLGSSFTYGLAAALALVATLIAMRWIRG